MGQYLGFKETVSVDNVLQTELYSCWTIKKEIPIIQKCHHTKVLLVIMLAFWMLKT